MKKRIIILILVAIMVLGCCFAFCSCDKQDEMTDTYVEIKCEADGSVFYLTFAPGQDELKIEAQSLYIYKNYLTVYDTTPNKTIVEHDVEVRWDTYDEYGLPATRFGSDVAILFDTWDGVRDIRCVVCWDITYKATGETRTVRLIVDRC